MRRKLLKTLLCAGLLLAPGPGRAEDAARAALWWRLERQERLADGRVAAILELRHPEPAPDEVEIFYSLSLLERRKGRNAPAAGLYHAVLRPDPSGLPGGSPGPTLFAVHSGKNAHLRLWARAWLDGRWHYAQSAFSIFGDGGNMAQCADVAAGLPDWPALLPDEAVGFYRAQVESRLNLRLVNAWASGPLRVFKNGLALEDEIRPDARGGYSYVPPYDEYIARGGPRVKQDYGFVATLRDGGVVNLTVPVYRGYQLKLDYAGGLAALGAAAGLTLALILMARRRSPYR